MRDTGAARATGATPCVPRVTIQEAYQSFCGEFFSLDFRGHRVVAGPAINHGEGQNRCHRAIKWVTGRVGELHDRTEAARGERTARTKRSGPTRSPGAWLRHCTRPHCLDWPPTRLRYGKRGTKRDQATGLPACRAANELRPLATARPRRFDEPARGTHEYLGRGAFGPPAADRGKRPGDFDPKELFGAAWWLTPL